MLQTYRVALAFELCDEGDGMMLLGRPQDFRVKDSRWQYTEMSIADDKAEYQIFIYARRWKGPGKQLSELEHNEHPNTNLMRSLAMQAYSNMNGMPVGDQDVPMAWNDPLDEGNFLDESDNPDDFDWVADDDDDDDLDGWTPVDGTMEPVSLDDPDDADEMFAAPAVEHPAGATQACPECEHLMVFKGVILAGNVLTGEPMQPVGRWDCADCGIILSDDHIDKEWGWQQWERQGNKRE